MYRELAFRSLKLAFIERGIVYIALFTISSTIYLFIFSSTIIYLAILTLSLIAIFTSILSDKRTIKQFISLMILSGARKKTVVLCLSIYLLTRVLPMALAYTTYLMLSNLIYIIGPTLIFYLLIMIFLPELLYKVIKR